MLAAIAIYHMRTSQRTTLPLPHWCASHDTIQTRRPSDPQSDRRGMDAGPSIRFICGSSRPHSMDIRACHRLHADLRLHHDRRSGSLHQSVRSGGAVNRATISQCGTYRYWLERKWAVETSQVFIMLNPSTADAFADDPTIRRCVNFAKREGAGGIIVVNLFALRSTDPKLLLLHCDPIGPENQSKIYNALMISKLSLRSAICAWGANSMAANRSNKVKELASQLGVELTCFGITKSGAPRHPLYVKGETPLVPF